MEPGVERADTWRKDGLVFAVATFLLSFALVVASQVNGGAYRADLATTADQAAHFVTSLMIHDYVSQALGRNPMAFALDFYAHFPRVAIGHWPPVFHTLVAIIMLVAGRALMVVLVVQAVMLAALAAAVAIVVARRHGRVMGGAAALAVLLQPTNLFQANAVMLDSLLALGMLLSVLAWERYAKTADWRWSLAFGLLACAAVLTKGNGYALALLPVWHAILVWRPGLLWNWRSWIAAGVVLALTGPWMLLTYKISSDGFVYSWGLAYTAAALRGFAGFMTEHVGWPILLLFAAGAARAVHDVLRGGATPNPRGAIMLAAVLAIFLFSCLVPADIQPRYLVPLLPPMIVLAADGAGFLVAWVARSIRPVAGGGRGGKLAVVAAFLLVGGMASVARIPYASSYQMDQVAERIMRAQPANRIVLMVGGPAAEGALIAAFAERDPNRSFYIVRGDKALASSNFMGRNYQARFQTAEALADWLKQVPFGWIVLEQAPENSRFGHVDQVAGLLEQQARVAVLDVPTGFGRVQLFANSEAEMPAAALEKLLNEIRPQKVIGQN